MSQFKGNDIMKRLLTTALCAGIFLLGVVSTANAALESRLNGHAVYDTDLNITWAADANINGGHNWFEQTAWAESLTIEGVGGWRLPAIDEMRHLAQAEGISSPFPGLFSNIQFFHYWSSTTYFNEGADDAYYYDFRFIGGFDAVTDRSEGLFAWPVHSGDVALIPEPETYAMLLVGLLAMFGFVRLRQQS